MAISRWGMATRGSGEGSHAGTFAHFEQPAEEA